MATRTSTILTFEFGVSDSSKKTWSPPFATSPGRFWQLHYRAISSKKSQHSQDSHDNCTIALAAIPNEQEVQLPAAWTERNKLTGTLYYKENALIGFGKIIPQPIQMDRYSLELRALGFSHPRSELPEGFIIGVQFSNVQDTCKSMKYPFPTKPIPSSLVDAWAAELNKQSTADVQFVVQEQAIYANSSILCQRSEYFRNFLRSKWAESNSFDNSNNNDNNAIVNTINNNGFVIFQQQQQQLQSISQNPQIKCTIQIPDFHPATFAEMLRFLYTDQVNFDDDTNQESSARTALAILEISDKYLIGELRQRAKERIISSLTAENSAEFLFAQAWKWPDVKKGVFDYVVRNFNDVRKSEGFQRIRSNFDAYPMATGLFADILNALSLV
ncbi:11611_t:CDS:2 [Ambispora gerdemannii]|uniref:11611_t:CDS:1 n=1 Tax=Ambispora gerdemannii TaxID=144530 RepID=A0A9N8YMZ7_9GLOM|nr:11611_t:CDS:2 [Ambispora gerdemannii]